MQRLRGSSAPSSGGCSKPAEMRHEALEPSQHTQQTNKQLLRLIWQQGLALTGDDNWFDRTAHWYSCIQAVGWLSVCCRLKFLLLTAFSFHSGQQCKTYSGSVREVSVSICSVIRCL